MITRVKNPSTFFTDVFVEPIKTENNNPGVWNNRGSTPVPCPRIVCISSAYFRRYLFVAARFARHSQPPYQGIVKKKKRESSVESSWNHIYKMQITEDGGMNTVLETVHSRRNTCQFTVLRAHSRTIPILKILEDHSRRIDNSIAVSTSRYIRTFIRSSVNGSVNAYLGYLLRKSHA